MDNLAYLHLADAHENTLSSELVFFGSLLNKAPAPDWKRLSSRAWKHMLPLALALSILSSVSSVLALERGDQGPSVRNLQEHLQKIGFFRAEITGVYDFYTEDAVRRFQQAHGLSVDGVVGVETKLKLQNRIGQRTQPDSTQSPVITEVPTIATRNLEVPKLTPASTPFAAVNHSNPEPPTTTTAKLSTTTATAVETVETKTIRRSPNLLVKGDEGEAVKVLQERLRVAGFYSGNPTGIFGPITEEAVKQFQAAHKLDVDGIVGPATLIKLPPLGVGGEAPPTTQKLNNNYLTLGHRGEPVRLLQGQLIKAGYLQGKANGYFGSHTADAVRRFQADNYLAASGIAGPTTRAKLYRLINTAPTGEFTVLEIQKRLQDKGFYRGNLNGVMADDTKKAIKAAQEFYGISLNDIKNGRF